MATDTPEETQEESPDLVAKPKSGKLKIIIVVVVVMLVEAGLFMFLMGGSSDAEQPVVEEENESATEELVEVSVGKFMPTNSQAAPGATIHITIEISALVEANAEVEFQQAVSKQYKYRVSQACLKVLRSANLDDLSDPDFGTISRLMKEQINKVLRKSIVREIVVSEFTKREQ